VTGCWTGRQSALRVLLGAGRAADGQEHADRGIGRELAGQLARRGDTVILTARDLATAERAAALPARECVLVRRLNVTDPASIQQVAADLDHRYGRLDVLVRNVAASPTTARSAPYAAAAPLSRGDHASDRT
jgi:NAD(P)-dependent dehydrogenase (short-subunit alcohol dehydrogenase family)